MYMTTDLSTLPPCWRHAEHERLVRWADDTHTHWGGVATLWTKPPTKVSTLDGVVDTISWQRVIQLAERRKGTSTLVEYEIVWVIPAHASSTAWDLIQHADGEDVGVNETMGKLSVLGHDAKELVTIQFGIVDADRSMLSRNGFRLVNVWSWKRAPA